ncbi:MAG: hypothetical protein Kow0069_09230 [Promethearchaeota archaeon]
MSDSRARRVAERLLWRPPAPELVSFFASQLAAARDVLGVIADSCGGDDALRGRVERATARLNDVEREVDGALHRVRRFTEATDGAIKSVEHELRALREHLDGIQDAVRTADGTIASTLALQAAAAVHAFVERARAEFAKAQGARYPHALTTGLGLALVLVPFLNLLSLVAGLHLARVDDYRARASGLVTLVLFFAQWINVLLLWW